jgi:hypothetical protein
MSNGNILRRGGNGPQLPQPRNIEDEIGDLARSIERGPAVPTDEHPALAACRKAAEMVRNVHKAHSEQSETLAQHIEHIGETFLGMCKEAANKIREQRILPEEMSNKTADELELMGKTETERQLRVSSGLKAARDAIVGIDAKS